MNRKVLAAFAAGLIVPLLIASYRPGPISPFYSATPPAPWENMGTITASQTALAVGARDFSAVYTDLSDAKTIKYEIPAGASGLEFRFQTTANANAHVVNLYICASPKMVDGTEDSFALGATLSLTGGQQVGPNSNVFVDTIVATPVVLTDWEVCDSATDRMCVARVDVRGYQYIVIIATTLQGSTTLYGDCRWY